CNFPESCRTLALLGADILALPTNWPAGRDKISRYLINTRAYENRVHFVATDRAGEERGVKFQGLSKIVNALGDTLAEGSTDSEEILYGEVNLADARRKHIIIKPGEFEVDYMNDRRPEMYGQITRPKSTTRH
ncbi:MAG: hypothetical protein PHU08_06995, partial [Dehalococcoidales bacterium]|nr:hypothetical protein [Dehalococcoidales bacterium]